MNNKKFLTVQDMVLIAVFVAIITVCSFIQISVGPVPFTLQTFGVFVTAGILGTKRGTLAVIVYILLGIIGVPVFCGAGGPGVIVGTTGGYITGFIFTILPLFYYPLKLFKTLLFKPFSPLLTYFVIHIKFVHFSCKRVKNVYKNHYINAL